MIKKFIIAVMLSLSIATGAVAFWPYVVPAAVAAVGGLMYLYDEYNNPVGELDPKPMPQNEYDDLVSPVPEGSGTYNISSSSNSYIPDFSGGAITGTLPDCQEIFAKNNELYGIGTAYNRCYFSVNPASNTGNSYQCSGQWVADNCDYQGQSWDQGWHVTFTLEDASYVCPTGTIDNQDGTCSVEMLASDGSTKLLTSPAGEPFLDPSDPDAIPESWQLEQGVLTHTETLSDGSTLTTVIETTGTIGNYSITTTQSDVTVVHSDGTTTTADIIDVAVVDQDLNTISSTHNYTSIDGTPESITDTVINKPNLISAENGVSQNQSLLDIESNTRTTNEVLIQIRDGINGLGGAGGTSDNSDLIDASSVPGEEGINKFKTGADFDTGIDSLTNGLGTESVIGSIDYTFLLPTSGSCQSITTSFKGNSLTFPSPDQCTKLGSVKEVFGWLLYVLTALSIVHIATRRTA